MSPRPKRAMKLIASGGHELRRQGQVAFVLAVFVVDNDHHATGAYLLHRLFHRGEGGFSLSCCASPCSWLLLNLAGRDHLVNPAAINS